MFAEALKGEPLPVEPWQVLSVERLPGDREFELWGEDGRRVLAWFDLGDVRNSLVPPDGNGAPPSLWERLKTWVVVALRPARVAWSS